MKPLYYTTFDSPSGKLIVASTEKGVIRIMLPSESAKNPLKYLQKKYPEYSITENTEKNKTALKQLEEYFKGIRKDFSLPLDLQGTPFQIKVLKAVFLVPFGETRSYGEIAHQIGNARSYRAVGNANRNNPIPLIIPCHRIIGSDGSLTGYGGGLELKDKLLRMEKKAL